MGVNLHVNEMALSALVSDSKRVGAKNAIFGVCVCVVHVFMCILCLCRLYVCIYVHVLCLTVLIHKITFCVCLCGLCFIL